MSRAVDYQAFAVLYVDDEEQSLKYFRKAFEKDFRILTASGGDEALALLERNGADIGIIVADQRMPGKTGVDVLGSARRTHPNAIRILTTAYSDLDSAIAAVNSGAIYKYVVKPWDIPELGIQLKRAMEFLLVQQERDLLLREKLSVLQRIVVTDRVKSLAALAAGLSHHIRNSMMALTTFLDMTSGLVKRDGRVAEDPANAALARGVWELAQQESQRILSMVRRVADAVVAPCYAFANSSTLQAILRSAAKLSADVASERGTSVRMDVAEDMPLVRTDGGMVERMFGILLDRALRDSSRGAGIVVTARECVEVWGTPGAKVMITSSDAAWSEEQVSALFTAYAPLVDEPRELGLDLLVAFFICQHHGGDILVHPTAPKGPGFEVLLPFNPEKVRRPSLETDCLEKLFTRFERDDIAATCDA